MILSDPAVNVEAEKKRERCLGAFQFLKTLGASRALQTKSEVEAAGVLVDYMGFPSHHDPQKNWDSLKCLHHILEAAGDVDAPILDAGSSRRSVILGWLDSLGYRSLYACDLRDKRRDYDKLSIKFSIQDLSQTNYADGFFQAVTCISVIEHGVSLENFAREMSRILRVGGRLLVSTDFWSEPVDCRGIFPYGSLLPEMKIFQPKELNSFRETAQRHGLALIGGLDLSTRDRVIHWERVDRRFTFAFMAFEKVLPGGENRK